MPERYKRVLIGWHCAKVKSRVELKIEKNRAKTFSYDFPRLHHSNPNSFGANVHLRPNFKKKQGQSMNNRRSIGRHLESFERERDRQRERDRERQRERERETETEREERER